MNRIFLSVFAFLLSFTFFTFTKSGTRLLGLGSNQSKPGTNTIFNAIDLRVTYPANEKELAVKAGILRIDPAKPPGLKQFNRSAFWEYLVSDSESIDQNLPAGSYMVGVMLGKRRLSKRNPSPSTNRHADHGRGKAITTVIVKVEKTGRTKAVLAIPVPSEKNTITVKVTDQDGQLLNSVERISVSWRCIASSNYARDSFPFRRNSTGNYVLQDLSEPIKEILAATMKGSLRIKVQLTNNEEREAIIRAEKSPHCTISFEPLGSLAVTFNPAISDDCLKHIGLSLVEYSHRLKRLEASNRLECKKIQAGKYSLQVHLNYQVISTHQIRISPSRQTQIAIDFPTVHKLSVELDSFARPGLYKVFQNDGTQITGLFMQENEQKSIYLRPGKYQLRKSQTRLPTFKFEVPRDVRVVAKGQEK